MREVFDRYMKEVVGDRDVITIADFYAVYCAIEIWHDRTPISFYNYKSAFYKYFVIIYRIIIRAGHIFHMPYDLGSLLITAINKGRRFYRIEWRKEWKKYNNSKIYYLTTPVWGSLIGKGALLTWLKETKRTFDVEPIELIDNNEEDDF